MTSEKMTNEIDPIALTRQWVEGFVVGLNLCPFARREVQRDAIRYALSPAETQAELIDGLHREMDLLLEDASIETTLLIHPEILGDFFAYHEFLATCDALLIARNLEGVVQIAGFHPDYLFADSPADDLAHYTNRSPFPMLHLLREESVSRAVESHPNIDTIPSNNIAFLRQLRREELTHWHELSRPPLPR